MLVAGSLTYLGITLGYFDPADYERAQTVYPEVETGVAMIRGGQVVAGITTVLGSLAMYFRIFSTTKLIPQSLKN